MSVDVRERLWHVINKHRDDRVIILTTHSMEVFFLLFSCFLLEIQI